MLPSLNKSARKGPQDLVGLDFGTSGLKVVRVKRVNDTLTLTGADVLAPVKIEPPPENAPKAPRLQLPKHLVANYAALCFAGEKAVVRVVTLPGHVDDPLDAEKAIRDHVGLDSSFRVAFAASAGPKAKNETRLLAVAIPEADAESVLSFVAAGAPAPYSLEVSGVAALNAALMGPLAEHMSEGVIAVDCGAQFSMLSIFNKGALVLARKLDVGGFELIRHIQRQFSVDAEMAQSILSQGAIDLSSAVKKVIDPFLRQFTMSRDFVERQENCRITTAYLSGGMSLTESWVREIETAAGIAVKRWNPFTGLILAPNAYPDRLEGQQTRFAAALGSVMSAFKEMS
jgi:Tfp pilus assembly PilM family ATPase